MSDEGIFNKDVSRREAMKTAAKGTAYAAPSSSRPRCPPPSPPRRPRHRRTTRRRSSRSSRLRAPPSNSPSPSTPTASKRRRPRPHPDAARPDPGRARRGAAPPDPLHRAGRRLASRHLQLPAGGEDLHRPADLHRHPADAGGGLRLRLSRRRPRVLRARPAASWRRSPPRSPPWSRTTGHSGGRLRDWSRRTTGRTRRCW